MQARVPADSRCGPCRFCRLHALRPTFSRLDALVSSIFDVAFVPLAGIHLCIWLTLLANLWYLRQQSERPEVAGSLPSVTVCIPARNEAENLRRLLPSLFAQNDLDLEVVVWDDGSDDGTWDVLQAVDDNRLTACRGEGPPKGWVGKVHALYQATRRASGDRYVFLDADAALADDGALARLLHRFEALPDDSVASGLPTYRGAAALLVSLVPSALLTGLPWPLVRRVRSTALAALNGQCWIIDAADYHAQEPHAHVRNEILEDVEIGRYLKANGMTPVLLDVHREVAVHMYASFGDAWRGFRKNAYLILGGSPVAFVGLFTFFASVWVVAPWVSPWLLASVVGLKACTDQRVGLPLWVTALAPVSFALGSALQFDSAVHHWTGTVTWKGRSVTSSPS